MVVIGTSDACSSAVGHAGEDGREVESGRGDGLEGWLGGGEDYEDWNKEELFHRYLEINTIGLV